MEKTQYWQWCNLKLKSVFCFRTLIKSYNTSEFNFYELIHIFFTSSLCFIRLLKFKKKLSDSLVSNMYCKILYNVWLKLKISFTINRFSMRLIAMFIHTHTQSNIIKSIFIIWTKDCHFSRIAFRYLASYRDLLS